MDVYSDWINDNIVFRFEKKLTKIFYWIGKLVGKLDNCVPLFKKRNPLNFLGAEPPDYALIVKMIL